MNKLLHDILLVGWRTISNDNGERCRFSRRRL